MHTAADRATREAIPAEHASGAAMAALVAAGAGAFAMGLVCILHETGIVPAPSLYAPAGGVSGRTTIAVVIWLIAWVVLHSRWRDRHVPARRAWTITLVLIALGILGTFPPVWSLL